MRLKFKIKTVIFVLLGSLHFIALPVHAKRSISLINDSTIESAFKQYASNVIYQIRKENEQYSKSGEIEKMNFVINFNLDTNRNYINDKSLNGDRGFLYSTDLGNKLNSRLRQVYFKDSVECYLVLINYFDVVFKAQVKDTVSIDDFFAEGKFYNENSNVAEMVSQHKSISHALISEATGTAGRKCIFLSLGNYCGSFLNDKKSCYTMYYHYLVPGTTTVSSSFLNPIYDDLIKSLGMDQDFRKGASEQKAITAVDNIERVAKTAKLKGLILKTYTSNGLKDILQYFSSNKDYLSLSNQERLHILNVFVNESMGGTLGDNTGAEAYALRILESVPPADVATFLHGLEQPSVLNNDPNFTGDKNSTDALVYRIVGGIDDHFLFGVGADNYKTLLKDISNLVLYSTETIKEFSSATPDNISDRMIYWDEYQTALTADVGYNSYTVEFETNGNVKYTRKLVDSLIVSNLAVVNHWEIYPSVTLRPFDLVVFINRSNCSMIGEGGAESGKLNFLPAVFLKYARDKAFNKTIMDASVSAVATTVDLVTLATGPGLFFKAVRSGRKAIALFEAFNTIGAGANLIANAAPQDLQLQNVVGKFNLIIGAWGLTRLGISGTLKLSNALESSMDDLKQISFISKKQATDYLEVFESAKEKINVVNGEFNPAQQTTLKKMKTFLEEEVGKVETIIENSVTTLVDNKISLISKDETLPNFVKQSFKNSNYKTGVTTQNISLYRKFGDKAVVNGAFTTTIPNATREELALVPEFNNSMQFEAVIEVPIGEKINVGKVGPWPPSNPILNGGADQIVLPKNYNTSWIKQIKDVQTGEIFTFEQFKQLHPDLVK